MKKVVFSATLLLGCLLISEKMSAAPESRNLLTHGIEESTLSSLLMPRGTWHPFPTIAEREKWEAIPETTRLDYIRKGEKMLHTSWEPLPLTTFLDFVRNGNRSGYEDLYFSRREKLSLLVLAEVFEDKGRFLDDIVNGIWAICEESYWGVPAHLNLQHKGYGLPDVTEPTVDLFAAETGSLLSWTMYLLEDQLKSVSPLLPERIYVEVDRRILTPCLIRDDFWWMGMSGERGLNNWTPWIDSNWLSMVLVLERDPGRRQKAVYKIMRSLDQFLNGYPEDGGCDEGPGYWGHAGASLFECLELLQGATGGAINLYGDPLIRKIGQYIYKVYIRDDYYINFADASAKQRPEAALIYRFGEKIQDPVMTGFGAFLARSEEQSLGPDDKSLLRVLPDLLAITEVSTAKSVEPLLGEVWFPDLQLMAARTKADSTEGLYLAAVGGHNGASHNHNDVGNFVTFADGRPVLIDVGVEAYTSKTFSAKRYEIWTMQSAYHNLPKVNGVMQMEGREFKATEVKFSSSPSAVLFSLNLAHAYPPSARLKSWIRTLYLDREKQRVELREQYELEEFRAPFQLSLMTPLSPDTAESGIIRLLNVSERSPDFIQIRYDPMKFRVKLDPIPLTDSRLKSVWGERIFRILLESRNSSLKGEYTLTVERTK